MGTGWDDTNLLFFFSRCCEKHFIQMPNKLCSVKEEPIAACWVVCGGGCVNVSSSEGTETKELLGPQVQHYRPN